MDQFHYGGSMDETLQFTNRCNPNDFMTLSTPTVVSLDQVRPFVSYFTLFIVVTISPCLIISPFYIPKLSTLCRKVMAMVVFSDFLNTILGATSNLMSHEWEQYKNETNFACAAAVFIENTSFLWSLCWSFILLCCVLLNLHATTVNKEKLFRVLSWVTWPCGVAVTLIFYVRPGLFPITYNKSYIFSSGCQPKYIFELADNGTKCLLIDQALAIFIPFYIVNSGLILASQVVFGFIVYRAYTQYKQMHSSAERSRNRHEDHASYEIRAEFSRTVLRNSIPFSVTAIVYVIIYIPVIIQQFVLAFHGPILGYAGLDFFLKLWFLCAGNFTTLINIVFYAILSKVMRQELKLKFKQLVREMRKEAAKRLGSVNESLCEEVGLISPRHSTNNEQPTFTSTPSDILTFFSDDESRISTIAN
ncbi:uncharacterized protein LOC134855504 isoform X1 [Symsagittifera roscoffensis]|uniref:uncharacterized protein LOC134855504 isoform X1 n=1 Tax=Symsagittifera roscoffensis TaxID=84072 RepID=UPI00307C6574